jgi:hypothetical protein
MTKAKAYLDLARPITVLMPMLGFAVAYIL